MTPVYSFMIRPGCSWRESLKLNQSLIQAHFLIELLPTNFAKLDDQRAIFSLDNNSLSEFPVTNLLGWLARTLLPVIHTMLSVILGMFRRFYHWLIYSFSFSGKKKLSTLSKKDLAPVHIPNILAILLQLFSFSNCSSDNKEGSSRKALSTISIISTVESNCFSLCKRFSLSMPLDSPWVILSWRSASLFLFFSSSSLFSPGSSAG